MREKTKGGERDMVGSNKEEGSLQNQYEMKRKPELQKKSP